MIKTAKLRGGLDGSLWVEIKPNNLQVLSNGEKKNISVATELITLYHK